MEKKPVIRIYVVLSSAAGDGKLRERLTVYEEAGRPKVPSATQEIHPSKGIPLQSHGQVPPPTLPCSSFQFLVCFEVPSLSLEIMSLEASTLRPTERSWRGKSPKNPLNLGAAG